MKCQNCGKYILDNSKECEFCGAIQEENKPIEKESTEAPKETITDKKWFSLIVGIAVVLIFIVLIAVFVSRCSFGESTEQAGLSYENVTSAQTTVNINTTAEVTTEEPTTEEPTTEEPTTEKPTEKPTEITDSYTKLYSDDNISLYYCSTSKYKYDDDEAIINFYVENYTDKILTISSGLFVLDGMTYNNGVMSDEIVGNTKGYIDAHINDINNFTPSTIGLSFSYYEQYNLGSGNKIEVKETKIE